MDDDEMLCDIMAAAILNSACAEARCRVSAEPHKWYLYVVHLDDHAHTCPACNWATDEGGAGYPRYFISNETLYLTERTTLVAELSRWLSHLHSAQLESGRSGSAPLDGNTPTSAPSDRGPIGSPAVDDVVVGGDGHRVVSVGTD